MRYSYLPFFPFQFPRATFQCYLLVSLPTRLEAKGVRVFKAVVYRKGGEKRMDIWIHGRFMLACDVA